ncbi:MAG: bifunctional oligoribonuclease/PAP phosphatase NrnA [Omnitrophica bacterium]|nr:bifunctional oligoribonuclease/PAP phosphatase NrnA [Candidatus Omnitrophota bacterium]
MEIKKIKKAIEKYDKFLITAHINPEGDSLGSQLAIASLLRALDKDVTIIDSDAVPEHYRFLPGVDLIRNKTRARNKKFDAAIVLDCPNLSRTGGVRGVVQKSGYIINIDHHVSNERFGDINWVEERASSSGEMVYRLFKEMSVEITKEVALYLYIAILTDTGSFNYDNTSGETHEIISELLGYGIEPYEVSKSVYENKSVRAVKLLGEALSGLEVTANGKVAYLAVRKKDFKRIKAKPADCEDFVNFARSIKDVCVALFFREDNEKANHFHVSLRSKGKVNVNKVAAQFGGGGHRRASGCTLIGSFHDVKKKVLKRVSDEL